MTLPAPASAEGHYHSHIRKGERRVLITIAVEREAGEAFLATLGEHPHRWQSIAVTLTAGPVAEPVEPQPAGAEHPVPVAPLPAPYDFGGQVRTIAALTGLLGQAGTLLERGAFADQLGFATAEFTAALHAAIGRRGGGA